MREVKTLIAAALCSCFAATLAATGCSSPKTADTGTTKSTAASPSNSGGFGANPPTDEQLKEFGEWFDGAGQGAFEATDAASKSIDRMGQAADEGDTGRFRAACQDATDPLTIRLPASLPTPDSDLTKALQALVGEAKTLSAACGTVSDPPTDSQLAAVTDAVNQVGSNLKTVGQIMIRNGDLAKAAAAGS
jgi:hypothetical protein